MGVKRWLVVALERSCEAVDRMWSWPLPFRIVPRLIGCPHGLALWSSKLDEHWATGVWWDWCDRCDHPERGAEHGSA
jgi:hypothetical protein